MESILISPKNKSDLRLLHHFLERLGIPSRALSEEDVEDVGLAILMKSVDRTKKVSRAEIMKKLQS